MTLGDDSAILTLPPSPTESRLLGGLWARLDAATKLEQSISSLSNSSTSARSRRVFDMLRLAIFPSRPARTVMVNA